MNERETNKCYEGQKNCREHKEPYYLGVAFDWKGKLDEAIEHYKQALQLKPDFPQARERLASALARQKQSKDVVQP
jgi:tetratricopeptide (TPR) repeat protein